MYVSKDQSYNSRCETGYIPDPADSELWAAFDQFSQEKNGSGLSAAEQLDRLNAQFPLLDIKWESLNLVYLTCWQADWHSLSLIQKTYFIFIKEAA